MWCVEGDDKIVCDIIITKNRRGINFLDTKYIIF